MKMVVTRKNHLIAEECGNADGSVSSFLTSVKIDNRLSKDNFKLYKVVEVQGGGTEFRYPKIDLSVGDVVVTEALGIDISFEGKKYKIFDAEHIVAKVKGL